MFTMRRLGAAIGIVFATGVAACSGGANTVPGTAPQAAQVQQPTAQREIAGAAAVSNRNVYVLNWMTKAIDVFPAGVMRATPIDHITQGLITPLALTVGDDGTLYVLNRDSIVEYASGSHRPTLKLDLKPLGIPDSNSSAQIAVDSTGTVYVAAFWNAKYVQNQIVEYDRGATTPSRRINLGQDWSYGYPLPNVNGGIALDAVNNLYVMQCANDGNGSCGMYVLPPRAASLSKGRSIGGTPGYPAGAAVDPALNQAYMGDNLDGAIDVIALPSGLETGFGLPPQHCCFEYANAIAADGHTNYLYVSAPKYVLIYNLVTQKLIGSLQGTYPRSIAVEP